MTLRGWLSAVNHHFFHGQYYMAVFAKLWQFKAFKSVMLFDVWLCYHLITSYTPLKDLLTSLVRG